MREIGAAVASGAPPASSADLFERLEARVVFLLERYRESQKALEELHRQLHDAEARASRLEGELAERDLLQDALRARLDQVIGWLKALEAAESTSEA